MTGKQKIRNEVYTDHVVSDSPFHHGMTHDDWLKERYNRLRAIEQILDPVERLKETAILDFQSKLVRKQDWSAPTCQIANIRLKANKEIGHDNVFREIDNMILSDRCLHEFNENYRRFLSSLLCIVDQVVNFFLTYPLLSFDHDNPFAPVEDIKHAVIKTRSDLIKLVVKSFKWQYRDQLQNISLYESDVVSYFDQNEQFGLFWFDAFAIRHYLIAEYLEMADELALREITEDVERSLPEFTVRVPDIHRGYVVKFKLWSNRAEDIKRATIPIEKLVAIIFKREKPSLAKKGYFSKVVDECSYNESLQGKIESDRYSSIIESIRIYQNSRLDVRFYDKDNAKRFADYVMGTDRDLNGQKNKKRLKNYHLGSKKQYRSLYSY
ncbi:MAG: hypothetical protein ACFFD4_39375 [Candidatus Odinarchaeota archaeon]